VLARLSAVPCAQSAAGIYSSDGSFDRFACLEDGDNTQVFNGAPPLLNTSFYCLWLNSIAIYNLSPSVVSLLIKGHCVHLWSPGYWFVKVTQGNLKRPFMGSILEASRLVPRDRLGLSPPSVGSPALLRATL
jgi:hypothetical protein